MDNEKNGVNFWVRGKIDQHKFYDIKLKTKTNFITFLFGLIVGGLLVLPFCLLVYQYFYLYRYNMSSLPLYFTLFWIIIMFFNAISNYLTVKLAQAYNKDMENLQELSAKHIFLYQLFNFKFGIVVLLFILLFALRAL